jgi:hypothetical protein
LEGRGEGERGESETGKMCCSADFDRRHSALSRELGSVIL